MAKKFFLTYNARDEDPTETQSYHYKFTSGEEIEIAAADEWLWWKLQANAWFSARTEDEVEEPVQPDPPVHIDPPVEPALEPAPDAPSSDTKH